MPSKSNSYRVRSVALLVAVVVAVGLIVYGGLGLYRWWQKTHGAPVVSDNFDVVEPDETVISVTDQPPFSYTAQEPKKIVLPSIGASGYIQKVGKTKDSAVGVPSNIHLAGWYSGSATPGDVGLSIVDGHLQGRYRDGIFHRLGEMKVGDTVQVIYGDDATKEFEVVSVKNIPVAQAGQAMLVKEPTITQQLTLITCGGAYTESDRSYAERVLVVTRLKKEAM